MRIAQIAHFAAEHSAKMASDIRRNASKKCSTNKDFEDLFCNCVAKGASIGAGTGAILGTYELYSTVQTNMESSFEKASAIYFGFVGGGGGGGVVGAAIGGITAVALPTLKYSLPLAAAALTYQSWKNLSKNG